MERASVRWRQPIGGFSAYFVAHCYYFIKGLDLLVTLTGNPEPYIAGIEGPALGPHCVHLGFLMRCLPFAKIAALRIPS